jgi:hypothetical protein
MILVRRLPVPDLETPAAHYARLAAEGWADPDLPPACSAQVTADGGRAVVDEAVRIEYDFVD